MIIMETGNILKVICKGINEFNTLMVLFTQDGDLEPENLV